MPALTEAAAAELFRREPDRYLPVDTGEVAYRRVGEGPDVLFVHGWPVSGATFRRLLPLLADTCTCHVIDLPGAGSGRLSATAPPSISGHVAAVRAVLDALDLRSFALVGHDSGGLIARHAVAGDSRLRSMGLIDTEQPQGLNARFQLFVLAGRVPGFGAGLAWVSGRRHLRRHPLVLGGAFEDPSLLDGEFEEFFLEPLRRDRARRDAAVAVLRSFNHRYVRELAELHAKITVPVQLVWGADDPFFPVQRARDMVASFPAANLTVVPNARLFSHEEQPVQVANALRPVIAAPPQTNER